MILLKEKIYSILEDLASEMGGGEAAFTLERPKEKSHGDLSSNIALVMAKKLKNSPTKIAQGFVEKLKENRELNGSIEKIEAVAPGFINFYFSKEYLSAQIQEIIAQGDTYGSTDKGSGKKVSVEFVSANPTGPLHIGNARGGPLGDIIANVFLKAGYGVTREYLHNDVGGQVEKLGEAIFYELNPAEKPEDYQAQYKGDYIKDLAKEVSKALEKELNPQKAGELAVEIMLRQILEDCKLMGIKFDKVTKESELRKEVPAALDKLKASLKENEGALWFAPSDEFLKDRETVVRKSNGEYTYFASDIAYHSVKLSQNDMVIDILGVNHSGHVPKLFAIAKALGFDPQILKVILYEFVRLKKGEEALKMSKREGNIVTAREVINQVGVDAFRFFLAMQNPSGHIDFDLELAKKKASDNPVFYVQYAYTRISSIFSKLKTQNLKLKNEADLSLLKEKEEIDLVRLLLVLPQILEDVTGNFAVNLITNYASELATAFHRFYEKHQVLSSKQDLLDARLALLKATQITLKNTLDILGISAPEKM